MPQNLSLNIYSLLPLFSSLVILFILAYLVGQRKRNDVNRAFILLFIDLFALTFLEFFVRYFCFSPRAFFISSKATGFFASCSGFLILNVVYAMANMKRDLPFALWGILCGAGAIFVLASRNLIAKVVSPSLGDGVTATPMFALLVCTVILLPEIQAFYHAVRVYRGTRDVRIKREFRFLFLGTLTAAAFYFVGNLVLPLLFHLTIANISSSLAFVTFSLVLFRAISKHKFLSFDIEEELARARQIESLGILAGGIAHDFNNMLTGILASFSLIKNSSDNPEVQELARDGLKASAQAAKLTRQLLTFAKGGEPVKETVMIGSLIRETVEFVLHGSRCTSTISMSDDADLVMVDRGQMAQVFQNLAVNAVQAMPNGGLVSVRGEKTLVSAGDPIPLTPGDYVRITFSDTGCGIAPSSLGRIFEPYFSTKPNGTGLGLATTYSIMKKHRGHITVSSVEEEGTTFALYLPAVALSKPLVPRKNIREIAAQGEVLIVDDVASVRLVLSKLLNMLGFATSIAQSGEEALQVYEAAKTAGKKFRFCIFDLTMPGGMSGKELGIRLLERDRSLKIIIASGYHEDSVLANFSEFGFVGALTKPFDLESLKTLVGEVLHRAADAG